MKTIIVGYDDTDPSRRALERAAQLAQAFGASLVVTSVAPVLQSAAPRSLAADPTDTAREHLAELASARAQLEALGMTAEYIEAVGHPADSIVNAAEARSADMIVVGTREVGFIQRLFGTSVSDAVSHRARCDVLIVH